MKKAQRLFGSPSLLSKSASIFKASSRRATFLSTSSLETNAGIFTKTAEYCKQFSSGIGKLSFAVLSTTISTLFIQSYLSVKPLHTDTNNKINHSPAVKEFAFQRKVYDNFSSNDIRLPKDLTAEGDPLQIKVATSLYENPIDALLAKVQTGKHSVQAVVYKFDNDQIYEALSEALRRGVSVQLICDQKENKKPKSKAYKLRSEGASVEFWDYNRLKKLHAKFTIVDSEYVLSGSSNWTKNADCDNMELVLQFNGNVKEFTNTFEEMWRLASLGAVES